MAGANRASRVAAKMDIDIWRFPIGVSTQYDPDNDHEQYDQTMSKLDEAITAALGLAWSKIEKLAPGVPDGSWYLTFGRSPSCATGPWNSRDDMVLQINLKQEGAPHRPNLAARICSHWAADAESVTMTSGQRLRLGLSRRIRQLGFRPSPRAGADYGRREVLR